MSRKKSSDKFIHCAVSLILGLSIGAVGTAVALNKQEHEDREKYAELMRQELLKINPDPKEFIAIQRVNGAEYFMDLHVDQDPKPDGEIRKDFTVKPISPGPGFYR